MSSTAVHSGVADPAVLATPTPRIPSATVTGADPLVLGLPLIAVGAIALGLQLVGFVNSASSGSPLALLAGASGLGLLVSTFWASRLRETPASSPWATGTSLATTVLGVLAAFFLSYAGLVLGLLHGWYGVQPVDVKDTVATFQISWLVVFVALTAASLRLPAAFTALFASFVVALALLLIQTLGPSATAGHVAGIVALAIGVAAAYVFLAVASVSGGGRELPIGRPIAG